MADSKELTELKELREVIKEELAEKPPLQERRELLNELAKIQEKIADLNTTLYGKAA